MGSIGRQFCGQYGQQLHWTNRVLLDDHIGNIATGPLDGLSILFKTLLGNIVVLLYNRGPKKFKISLNYLSTLKYI